MIRRLIKLVVITVATLVFGSALYLQFSNVNWSVKCASGDYNYGCNASIEPNWVRARYFRSNNPRFGMSGLV